jgi:UDP-N-acetylmuramoyl-tripeptide--D-alanyl-D-alanine ligase
LKTDEILKATGGRVLFGEPDGIAGVSIDSRTIKEGELFIAIKGALFDGHDFLNEALAKGAGAIVSVPPMVPFKGKTIIYVPNTIKSLQDIARYMRRKRNVPVVGITGTNGKTTTKELIASILGIRRRVLKNTGNLNNQIGLPLSLLKLTEEDEVVVLEMGASAKGDISELCAIAEPDYGVLTNIGYAHLEGFGNIETIRQTKLEILGSVKTIVVNAEDGFLMEGINGYGGRIVTYGFGESLDVSGKDIALSDRGSVFTLCVKGGGSVKVGLKIQGMFNVSNALAASAVGYVFGMDMEEIRAGLEAFEGMPMRYEIKDLKGVTVISDAYNANPGSMEEAIKELVRIKKTRAIAVLGDMLELGSYAGEAHRRLGAWMSTLPVEVFIAVGPNMSEAAGEFARGGGKSIMAASAEEAREALLKECADGDTVLVKGSRGMKMEGVLENAL